MASVVGKTRGYVRLRGIRELRFEMYGVLGSLLAEVVVRSSREPGILVGRDKFVVGGETPLDSRTESSGGRVLGKVVQMSTTKCGKCIRLYNHYL